MGVHVLVKEAEQVRALHLLLPLGHPGLHERRLAVLDLARKAVAGVAFLSELISKTIGITALSRMRSLDTSLSTLLASTKVFMDSIYTASMSSTIDSRITLLRIVLGHTAHDDIPRMMMDETPSFQSLVSIM